MAALVSVIIPTFYRNDLLESALESALSQTHSPVEIIVVDDSGEEHAYETVNQYDSVRYIANESNLGAHAAREVGFDAATGEFVQFLDDDDCLVPQKLERQLDTIQSEGDVGVVYCGSKWDRGHTVTPDQKGTVLRAALSFKFQACTTTTMLIDANLLDEVHPFGRYQAAQDNYMIIELAQATEFDFVLEPLVYRRDTQNSLGDSMKAVEARFRIINEFDELYSQYGDEVRDSALAETFRRKGHSLLDDRVWSVSAIAAFLKAVYHAPSGKERHLKTLLLSLFGRYGRDFGRQMAALRRTTGLLSVFDP